jgi:hypothetical protein
VEINNFSINETYFQLIAAADAASHCFNQNETKTFFAGVNPYVRTFKWSTIKRKKAPWILNRVKSSSKLNKNSGMPHRQCCPTGNRLRAPLLPPDRKYAQG